ncbi:MAG: hypothetical protein JST92_08540 [Deltaproteobacteria bacterium]|nr:hypothetical protein [Deltaproteobacteria bacterium]
MQLPEAALRELLETGPAGERVWAAWALGLRLGPASASTIQGLAQSEPVAGIRRHLVVLLAGFGERGAVTALATGDPDGHVRATACQYLVRLASSDAALWDTVRDRFSDVDAVVRETLLLHLPDDAPERLSAAAARLFDDPSRAVRELVVSRLDVLIGPGALPEAMKDCALAESVAELRRSWFAAWCAREGGQGLIAAVARTPHQELALEALACLEAHEPLAPWRVIEPLAHSKAGEVLDQVFSLFRERLDEAPLEWLLRYLAGRRRMLWYATGLTVRLASRETLDAGELAALRAIGGYALDDLASGADEYDPDVQEWEADLKTLLVEVRRLCGEPVASASR